MVILYLKIQCGISRIWCYQIYLVIPTTCQFPDDVPYVAHLKASTVRRRSLDGCHTGYMVRMEEVAYCKSIGVCILPKFCHIWIAVHARYKHCFMSLKVLIVSGFILNDIVLWPTENVFNCNSRICKWLASVFTQNSFWDLYNIVQLGVAAGIDITLLC
jgi:hypothetical protein